MARTALYAPAHRVLGRFNTSLGPQAQSPAASPSFDAAGIGIQDARWKWNAGSSASAPQIIGWMDPGAYPVIDLVPATLANNCLAAAQVPVSGTPMTLVPASGAGVVVPTLPTLMFPGGTVAPITARFIQAIPNYIKFGAPTKQQAWAYDPSTTLERAITVTSAGNDSTATMQLTGIDQYGFVIHQNLTMAAVGTVTTTKGFKALLSALPVGTLSGSNVSIGTADVFGLPFYASQQSQLWGYWNNLILVGLGTFVAGVTAPSTAITGDTAGTWAPPNPSDGVKRLTMWMHPSASAMATLGINAGLAGVVQF